MRVVIVGGGFAGLFAARALRNAPVQVTLLDRAEHHLFPPLLYQCATGILSQGKIAFPLRELLERLHNLEFVLAEVTGIDAEHGRVLARRPLGEQVEFGYDYLILAAGVRQSYFGHDEYAAFAPGMKTIEDARRIRRRIFGAFEMAESADDPAERRRWLTFALVGAGPTGVELAGQVREVATKTLRREYRHIKPDDARVLLFDGGKAPLEMFGPKLSAPAAPSSPPRGCTSADSSAGSPGCSSTSASSPAGATASGRCSAGGSPSPATCAENAASPSTTCRSTPTANKPIPPREAADMPSGRLTRDGSGGD